MRMRWAALACSVFLLGACAPPHLAALSLDHLASAQLMAMIDSRAGSDVQPENSSQTISEVTILDPPSAAPTDGECSPEQAAVTTTDAPDESADVSAVPVVSRACESDADCAVKNVGNCCGYYPACVNKDADTFPERVAAECAKQGVSSICGFPEIPGCRCVAGQCEAKTLEHHPHE